MSSRNWIQHAIKRPGSLRARMRELGLVKPGKPIPVDALKKAATGAFGPKTAQRARTALTLRKLRNPSKRRKPKRGSSASGYRQTELPGTPLANLVLNIQEAVLSPFKPQEKQPRLFDWPAYRR